ncbi:single-stranded DNA-binding protein [Alcanivorax sp.]|uniref:single-stranded DNA-binding protein n=1 Tax=Alcanivorax sp. TaxID=1872427 RepID=UPI003BABB3DB
MLEIELNTNDCQIQTRSVNGKNGQRTIHEQQAYLHTGAAYPIPFKLSIRNAAEAYPSGKYTLHPSSFQVNQFGGLELNRFEMRLVPIKAPAQVAQQKAAASS